MYRCPNCGSTESFYADGEFSYFGWAQFDSNGEIVDMCNVDRLKISNFELGEMRCDECGYEAPADEFED